MKMKKMKKIINNQQIIINKLPEIIKCIIYDHVSRDLNYLVELQSDKFIGNPVNYLRSNYNEYIDLYHVNKLTGIKNPLHFIELACSEQLLPQEILNKLQKFIYINDNLSNLSNLNNIKILKLYGNFTEIPNFTGLLEFNCRFCFF